MPSSNILTDGNFHIYRPFKKMRLSCRNSIDFNDNGVKIIPLYIIKVNKTSNWLCLKQKKKSNTQHLLFKKSQKFHFIKSNAFMKCIYQTAFFNNIVF